MKIGIHHNPGSFSDRWIEYCNKNNISYKIVDCYDNEIIEQLSDCDALMWHHHHADYRDTLFAKQLLYSIQQSGKKVFPDFNSTWHFDDKVGQKYILEAIRAPLVPSFIFYNKKEALEWINITTFPKVFKLRGGAGSANVKLVHNKHQSTKLIKKAFGKGFPAFNRMAYCKERIKKYLNGKDTITGALKGIGRLFIPIDDTHLLKKEKGYVYFQEFMPNNSFDIRVIVIGDKAFAIKRLVRKNDFRASGSGSIVYSKDEIDIRCVKLGFETSAKLKSQCLTYDFIFDQENKPKIVEISYGFSPSGYFDCPGFWDEELNWHKEKFNPYGWMVDLVLAQSEK